MKKLVLSKTKALTRKSFSVYMVGASFSVRLEEMLTASILKHRCLASFVLFGRSKFTRRKKGKTGFVINISYLYWYLIMFQLPHQSLFFFNATRIGILRAVSLIILPTLPAWLLFSYSVQYSTSAVIHEKHKKTNEKNR